MEIISEAGGGDHKMFNSDRVTHAYSEKYASQRKYGAGRMHGNICTRPQCGVIKKAAEVDQPFPTKPVSHKKLPRTQDRFGLQDFEKTTLSQHRGRLMPLEYHSGGIQKTPRFFQYSDKMQIEELQMTRAIQMKELLLQEKLWRVGEKIRQTIQRGSSDIAAGSEHISGKERHYTRQDEWGEVHTKGRLSEYQREPLRRGDMLDGDRLHKDLMQLKIKQGERTEDRIRNKHDLQQARWEANEYKTKSVQTGNLRLEKLNEPFTRKKDEKDYGAWKETGARYKEQNEASVGNPTWTREKKERTQRNTDGSDYNQNMSQKSLHKLATGNQRRTGENLSELTLPLLSGSFHRSQRQQAEPTSIDTKVGSFQLLPCKFCNRTFQRERLEKHIQICAKISLKQRQVFNSSAQRYKGSQLEEYYKTHNRNKTPEVLTRKKRQNHKKNF